MKISGLFIARLTALVGTVVFSVSGYVTGRINAFDTILLGVLGVVVTQAAISEWHRGTFRNF